MLQDPFVVQPGDSFRTSCYFNAKSDTVFGLSSSEEMCMAFLYYYPRSTIQVPISAFVEGAEGSLDMPWMCGLDTGFDACESEHTKESLTALEELDRAFGVPTDECISTDPAEPADDQNDKSASAANFRLLFTGATIMLAGFAL